MDGHTRNELLLHDAGWTAATSIIECLRELKSEGKLDEAFIHIYVRVKAAVEAVQIHSQRHGRRMRPSRN